jgi:hypothetical protein
LLQLASLSRSEDWPVPFYPGLPTPVSFPALLASFGLADTPSPLPRLDDSDFRRACERHGAHFAGGADEVWSPALTLWAFLWQAVSSSKSCAAAVARALTWRLALGLAPCSTNTGAYCKARRKLPEALVEELTLEQGERLEQAAPARWLWRGRRVRLIDGTVVTAADTKANQAAYPQRDRLPAGAGFPLVRGVVLLGLATAACTGAAVGPYKGKGSGEASLARALLGRLAPGDVLLGDRLFATYWLIAGVLARKADAVFRLHAHRGRDGGSRSSRLLRPLGDRDNLVAWQRPNRPEWMDEETYGQMPRQLRVRIVWRRVEVPGFRTQEVVLVTTLLDAEGCPAEEVVALYRQRWLAELHLRTLKQTLRMEHLACKSPEMVRKELWAHLLGYNLIRAAQAQAAVAGGVLPRRMSFATARGTVEAMRELLAFTEGPTRQAVVQALWAAVGREEVGERPDRVEPRRVKRGPKPYPRLRESRAEARRRILGGAGGPGEK